MKCAIIFVIIFIKYCDSNDFKCGYFDEEQESMEFYCDKVQKTVPVNCSKSFLYTINFYDKTNVTQLKIGGCDEDKISQLVKDFRNIRILDISYSGLQSLALFKNIKLEYLVKLNASHNRLTELFSSTDASNEISAIMPQLTEFDLSYNKLFIIWALPTALKKLDISHNRLEFIYGEDLIEHNKVEYVDLSKNYLWGIDHKNLFVNAKHLKTLRLEDNRYATFDGRFLLLIRRGVTVHFSWKYVREFEILESLGKPIRVITNRQRNEKRDGDSKDGHSGKEGIWFSSDGKIEFHCNEGSFRNLKMFTFIGNHIENPSELLRCLTPSVERLELSGKFNEQLNFTLFERFINLWSLTINDAHITELDINSLKIFTNLFSLNLSYNNLRRINNVELLENETKIYLWNFAENHIENVPEFIQHLKLFTYNLNLSGNYVGKLNATTFQRLKYLRLLNLSNTSLSFDDLTPLEPVDELEQLDISYNNLGNSNFTSNTTCFKRLRVFNAAHCNITNASELIKLFGPPIQTINLAENHLEKFDANTFDNLTNLETLNVSRTNLIEIDFGIFSHSLFYNADLSFNNLKSITVTSAAKRLVSLHLDENELTDIEPFTTLNFPALWTLSISKNQIPCTALAQLKQQRPNLKFFDNPLQQKHGDCSNVDRLIDNLGFVGTLISKWF